MTNLKKIQNWINNNNIDFVILNRSDEYLNEYIAPYAERLKWISNFSGSAGRAIISMNKAIIFVDGRYTDQVKKEVNKKYFIIKHINQYWDWLEKNIGKKKIISIDPRLHSIIEINKLKKIIIDSNCQLKLLYNNPIDFFWKNQPKYSVSNSFFHEKKYSGKTTKQKIESVCSLLKKRSVDYYFLNSLDSIAWLLNIRGRDLSYTPFIFCYAVICQNKKVNLFIDIKKIRLIKKHLKNHVNFLSINKISNFFEKFDNNFNIGMDINRTNYYFKDLCEINNIKIKYENDPCYYLKSIKNNIEINGAKKSNFRDGLSVTKFIYWLKNKMKINDNDELSASKFLYNLRKKNKLFFSLSFETISAIGKNSSFPHYRLTKKSNLTFKENIIYLIDSGAQYLDGTTDITRTVVIGRPTKEHKDRFTRVLKGHIAIATAEFGKNTKGSDLDPLARKDLKKIGCDFDHGTGHGIGSFANVHEGPQRISKSYQSNDVYLKQGMILSNEPGYYKKNKYGIRIENLIIVIKKSNQKLAFNTISLAPIDIDLVDKKLLTKKEISWINNYHAKVKKSLSNFLNDKEKKWLNNVTKSI